MAEPETQNCSCVIFSFLTTFIFRGPFLDVRGSDVRGPLLDVRGSFEPILVFGSSGFWTFGVRGFWTFGVWTFGVHFWTFGVLLNQFLFLDVRGLDVRGLDVRGSGFWSFGSRINL